MAIRYFNLKEGSDKVNGGVIRVDSSLDGLEKLTDFDGDFASNPWTFRHLRKEGEDDIYDVVIPDEEIAVGVGKDALGGRIGVPSPVSKGSPHRVKLKLTPQGELKLYQPSDEFYLSEMSEEEAKKNRGDGARWAMQRAYICE